MYTFGTTHRSPYDARREADHGTPLDFEIDPVEVARFREAIEAHKGKSKPRQEAEQETAIKELHYDLAAAGLV